MSDLAEDWHSTFYKDLYGDAKSVKSWLDAYDLEMYGEKADYGSVGEFFDTNRSFLENLLSWSAALPERIRKLKQ